MDDCMGIILSSVPLLTHQSCRVSTLHVPTFRQQCNISPRFTVSAFHPVPSFLFHVECFLQLGPVVDLDKDNKDGNNPLLRTLCFNDHRTKLHWNSRPLLSSCSVKIFNSAVRSCSLKKRDDHIFGTSTFVRTGLESLQICIKLKSSVVSCRQRLTRWVKV